MAEDTSKRNDAGLRARRPTTDDAAEVSGHKWEPHTPEQDERLATPAPPPPPTAGPGAEWD